MISESYYEHNSTYEFLGMNKPIDVSFSVAPT